MPVQRDPVLYVAIRSTRSRAKAAEYRGEVRETPSATHLLAAGVDRGLADKVLHGAKSHVLLQSRCSMVFEESVEPGLGPGADVWLGLLSVVLQNLEQIREFAKVLVTRLTGWGASGTDRIDVSVIRPNGEEISLTAEGTGMDRVEGLVRQIARVIRVDCSEE